MILNPLLEKIQTAILAVIFLAAGLYTFGNALVFDRLFIGILVFAGWLCRKDLNLLSIIALITLIRIVEEVAWINLTNAYMVKLPLYCLCTYLIYRCCYDGFKWYSLTCLALVFSAEIYWLATGYQAPEVYWDVYYLTQSIVIRWTFVNRCFWMCNLLPDKHLSKIKSLDLDYILSTLTTGYLLLSSFKLYEYLLRHIFGFHSIDYVYNVAPYVSQLLSTFILFTVFITSLKFKQFKSINA